MSYQLTKKEIVKELVKSGKSPGYFINKYVKISHPIHGLVPFHTYDFQDEVLEKFNDYRFNVVLKARQMGISTLTAAYIVWLMMFYRDKNILVMATKFHTASNLVKKVKAIMKALPDWIRIAEISIDNRASFELSNGSQIKASSTSADAGRSEALSLLVIDEAAHVEGMDELWVGLYSTLSTGGRCISISTPNGVGNWFHKTYIDADEGRNDFHPTSLKWDLHPDRDQDWFDKETRNMTRRQIAQELECNFNMSGETVINPEDIDRMMAQCIEPKYRAAFDRNFWIFQKYDPTNSYLLSADVARGDGQDYSVFHIIKLETMEVVAEYQGKPDLDQYSQILFDAGKEYGGCMMVVENNNVGYSVLTKLIDMGYNNIYYSTKTSHEYVEQASAEYMNNVVPGFTTSMKTRPLIIAKLEEFVRNDVLRIYSTRVMNELKTFIWHNGKPQAMKGENDDLVMSLAIACWVRDTAILKNQQDVDYKKAFIDAIYVSNNILDTKIPGQPGYKQSNQSKENQMKPYVEYSWLVKG